MNCLLLAFAMAAPQQGLDRLVSAEVKAAPAPIAIAELAKQIGYPLEAMPSTAKDFLIIKVDKVPLNRLMEQIADVTNTAWEKSGDGYRLIRNDTLVAKEAAEEKASLIKLVQASLDKVRAKKEEQAPLTEVGAQTAAERLVSFNERQQAGQQTNWQEYQSAQGQAPANRLLRRVMVNLSAETIASVPSNRRVVFSTRPNRMQAPLPQDLSSELAQFLKEQAIWSKALRTARERRGDPNQFYFENMSNPGNRKVGKVLIILNRQDQGRGITVQTHILDTAGKALGTGSESLGFDTSDFVKQMSDMSKAGENEPPLVFTGRSKLLYETLRDAFQTAMQSDGQPNVNPTEELTQLLLAPDQVEPLSLTASDAVIQTAQYKKLNLVCSAPDSLLFAFMSPAETVKPSAVLLSLPRMAIDVRTEDGWLLIQPLEASRARYSRVDRTVLGQYVRQAHKEGRISLDNRASYAFRSGVETEDFLGMFILTLTGVLKPGNEYGGEWDALRLFGSLNTNQRRAATNSQPIPFRSLTAPQLEIIRHIVFDSPYSRLSITHQEVPANAGQEDEPYYYGPQDPTELLPNGFTGLEVLNISDQTSERLFGQYEPQGSQRVNYGETSMDPSSLAFEIFQTERPELFPWRNQPGYPRPSISKVKRGSQRMVQMSAQFTPTATLDLSLNDKTYTSGPVSLDKLPPEIKKQIDETLAKLREQYKDAKPPDWNPGGGGTRVPPPLGG